MFKISSLDLSLNQHKRLNCTLHMCFVGQAKIVDLEGKLLPVNEPGELYTRGYTTMLGYWNASQKTAEVIKSGGWYATG